jgi:carbonic anhydrase/acetyltransferase-like protein (isoleucine patch superfamily)
MEKLLFNYGDLKPKIHASVFLAPGVKIVGDVEIDEGSSVWFNTVIRGDVHFVKIGKYTNIQDCSMLHVTGVTNPVIIGDKVTIGHSVKLHGCTIQDLTLIGIGSVVLDGAVVEQQSMVAAGAVVTPNFIVPHGKLVAGVPAKVIRDLTKEEMNHFEISAINYNKFALMTEQSIK